MKILVIPSNRPDNCREFLRAWRGKHGADQVFVIEDAPERTFLPDADRHYCWADIARTTGEDSWIFSKRDSAIRCFGLLAAYHAGADFALTLDDDCFPQSGTVDFMGQHIAAMSGHLRWKSTLPVGVRPRGLPYKNPGKMPAAVANVGLWAGVPDLDGRTQLENPITDYRPPAGSWLVPHGVYAPLCGMNLCIRREALPLFYFPLMGEGSPYKRFDDIWGGIIAKKICDHLGWHISIGEPFVEHCRASDARANAVKEAPGIEANETFWEVVDRVDLFRDSVNPHDAVFHLGAALRKAKAGDYIERLGYALQVWTRLLCDRPVSL